MSDTPQSVFAPRTLLVVDEQHGVGVSLSFLPGNAGHSVLTAESGRAALAVLDAEPIDGAILDVHMPVMNGFDTCIALQARAATLGRSLHVWFMTGAFTNGLERRCAELGGLGVLHKPFDLSVMLAQLEVGFSASPPSPLPLSAPSCAAIDAAGINRLGNIAP